MSVRITSGVARDDSVQYRGAITTLVFAREYNGIIIIGKLPHGILQLERVVSESSLTRRRSLLFIIRDPFKVSCSQIPKSTCVRSGTARSQLLLLFCSRTRGPPTSPWLGPGIQIDPSPVTRCAPENIMMSRDDSSSSTFSGVWMRRRRLLQEVRHQSKRSDAKVRFKKSPTERTRVAWVNSHKEVTSSIMRACLGEIQRRS